MAKKYIDTERLRAEAEKRMHICDGVFERNSDTYYQGKAVAYQEILSFIDSLQQEQPIGIHDIGVEGEKGVDGGLILQEIEGFCRNAAEGETQVTPTQKFLEWADRLGEYRRFCKENCKGYQETGKCFCDGECDAKRKFDKQEQTCDTCTNDKGCVTCKDGELWEGKEQPCERVDVEKHIDEMFEKQGYGIMLNTSEHLTIEEEAKLYSFNIESKIFNSLPQELQGEWRKEIESAYIIGASAFRVSSEDLEAKAAQYESYFDVGEQHGYLCVNKGEMAEAFKDGARWQKEQMLKNAEECDLYWDGDFLAIELNMRVLGYSERDKVKIVIIPDKEEKK